MPLPPYYLEVIMVSGVACLAAVVMNGWGGLQVLFVSFTKGPGGFAYVQCEKEVGNRRTYGAKRMFVKIKMKNYKLKLN